MSWKEFTQFFFLFHYYFPKKHLDSKQNILWSSGKGQARIGKDRQGMAVKAKGLKALTLA